MGYICLCGNVFFLQMLLMILKRKIAIKKKQQCIPIEDLKTITPFKSKLNLFFLTLCLSLDDHNFTWIYAKSKMKGQYFPSKKIQLAGINK